MLVLAAVALAGCGGDVTQENDYVEQVGAAQRAYVDRFEAIRVRLTATSTVEQDRQTLADFSTATERFVAKLKAVTRPGRVADEHAELVGALERYERRIDVASRRLESGSATERAKVRTELSSSVVETQEEVVSAIAAINKALRA